MPSLMRFLAGLMVVAALAGAGVYALATMVEPSPREMVFKIPQDRFEAH